MKCECGKELADLNDANIEKHKNGSEHARKMAELELVRRRTLEAKRGSILRFLSTSNPKSASTSTGDQEGLSSPSDDVVVTGETRIDVIGRATVETLIPWPSSWRAGPRSRGPAGRCRLEEARGEEG
eukprot:GHVU01223867.1.p2 GENE.GHVU01223867.1~~GHVU01223867.1.p2  ORF type:complete len:127 (+),score=8.54 GHVU01223867.1:415-795(+)